MLKLYLNENLSWRIAKALREYGYDVISSGESGMNQYDDEAQLAFAAQEGRTIVTNNFRDFVELDQKYEKEGKTHCGIIFTTKCTLPIMIRRLRVLLETVQKDQLINQIRWLNEFE